MPDKCLAFNYPTPALLHPVLGSFFGAQTNLSLAAMESNQLACRNGVGDYESLAVYLAV